MESGRCKLYCRGTILLNGGILDISGGYNHDKKTVTDDSSHIDLRDGIMKVGGNVILHGGTMDINGGILLADQEFQLEGLSMLNMQNEKDYVGVNGNFVVGTETSFYEHLTAGVLELKSNFTVNGPVNELAAGGTHKVVLSGTSKQTINMENMGYEPHIFNILILTRPNTSENYEFVPAGNVFWNALVNLHNNKIGVNDGKHAPVGEFARTYTDMISDAPEAAEKSSKFRVKSFGLA